MSPALDMFFAHLTHWHWGFLAVGLVLLEILMPRSFFLWLGLASGVVGGVLFFHPALGWPASMLWFVGGSVVSVGLSRLSFKPRAPHAARPTSGRCGSQHVGKVFTLAEPVRGGVGRVQVNGVFWTIVGQDMTVGRKVKVLGFDGAVLSVEMLEE